MKTVLLKLRTTLLMLLAVMAQSVWAEEAAPPNDKLGISNVTAQVVWSKSQNKTLSAYYDSQSQLYWALPSGYDPKISQPLPLLIINRNDARAFISSLIVDGQGGWTFPSFSDVTRANERYSLARWSTYKYLSDTVAPVHFFTSTTAQCRQGAIYGLATDDQVKAVCAEFVDMVGYGVVPVRRRSIYDDIIDASDKSLDEKLAYFSSLLVSKKLMVIEPTAMPAPKAPQFIAPKSLTKGEFETSIAYQKRADAENENVRIANEATQRKYEKAVKEYEVAVAAQQREFAELARHNREPAVQSAAFASVLPEVMDMVYGDPVLTDLKYDADKQVFTGALKSQKGGFNHAVEFPVSLDRAAQVKEQLNSFRLIPSITFNANGTKLTFVKMDIVENGFNAQHDFAQAKSADTIQAYENFIKSNPKSPLVAQAKQCISSLQVSAKRGRERERQSQQSAALAEQRAREEERQFAMLGICEIGGTVYHRERWNTTTSSGNAIADAVFGAATKEQFLIEFEAVVEGFVGNKVKVLINDYRVQQTKGGGFLSRKTYQGESLGLYADKYLGKTQYYPRSRCSK